MATSKHTANSKIIKDGLWTNNAGLVQLLGLCPLLAVSNTVVNGLGMGLATIFVMVASNATVSLIRGQVRNEIRIPVFVMVIAGFVTAVELWMQAYLYQLFLVLGIFLPLITTNCVIIGRAEAFASKHNVWQSALDGFMMGLGFTAVLVLLGGMRELIGRGTLFAEAEFLFGPIASNWTLTFATDYPGFLLAVLPPGAFIGLGLLIALKNWIDNGVKARQRRSAASMSPSGVTS